MMDNNEDTLVNKISEIIIKKVPSMEETKMADLWSDSTCVIIFFRRFGCVFCRESAKEISSISSILSKNNIKLIGIGFDEFGVNEFIQSGYFNGEIYLDVLRSNYKILGLKKYTKFGMIRSLLDKRIHRSFFKIKNSGVPGNWNGDPFQNGGAIVVTSKSNGSKLLLSFKQDNPVDFVSNNDILRVLNIV